MKGFFWIFAAATLGSISGTAALATGSAEAGAGKATVCQGCHGANGNSINPDWPSLAGIGADYMVEQLQNFKDGKRSSPIMMPMAAPLNPQDMADLAAHFDGFANTGLEADPAHLRAGEKLYRGGDKSRGIPACMACHGPDGRGNEPAKFPALSGQHSAYAAKQLNDYASGARPAGPGGIMGNIAKKLSPDDIRNLSSYVQGLR